MSSHEAECSASIRTSETGVVLSEPATFFLPDRHQVELRKSISGSHYSTSRDGANRTIITTATGDESLSLPYPVSENYITCRDVACIQKLYRKYVHPLKKHLNDGDSFSYWDPEIIERMNHLLRNASPMSEVSIRSKKLGGQDKAFYVQMLLEDLCILYKEIKGYD